jgi:hypothetical protein
MHTDAKGFYAILEVAPTASEEVIRAAFRRRAKELHPDVSAYDGSEFVALQLAYDELSDASARAVYDHECSEQEPPPPPGPRRRGSPSTSAVPVLRRDSNIGRYAFAFTVVGVIAFFSIWMLTTLADAPPSSAYSRAIAIGEHEARHEQRPSSPGSSDETESGADRQQPTLFFWEQPRSRRQLGPRGASARTSE